jgi:CubicO group peptidase (beta-lactamase class C family)
MMTNHLTAAQRDESVLFLEGPGWGFGGSVDITTTDRWTAPGRYGWVDRSGATGTAAHINPTTGTVSISLTQRMMTGPTPPPIMRAVWSYAAGA